MMEMIGLSGSSEVEVEEKDMKSSSSSSAGCEVEVNGRGFSTKNGISKIITLTKNQQFLLTKRFPYHFGNRIRY